MPKNGGELLLAARKAAGMTQKQVYMATRISESNLQRWESNNSKPDLEDLYKLELLYHAPGLWSQFLLATSDAYAAHHPVLPQNRVPLAHAVGIGKTTADMLSHQDKVERDLVDGVIDDLAGWNEYMKDVRAVNAATGALLLQQKTEEGTT